MVSEPCEQLKMERADFRFSRRDVREFTGWSDPQVKRHLHKLANSNTCSSHRGGRGQSFVYELLYFGEGRDGADASLPRPVSMPTTLGQLLRYDKQAGWVKKTSGTGQGAPGAPGTAFGEPWYDGAEANEQRVCG